MITVNVIRTGGAGVFKYSNHGARSSDQMSVFGAGAVYDFHITQVVSGCGTR